MKRYVSFVSMLAVAGILTILTAGAARADIVNYTFSGTLASGQGTVSGTFTLDNSGAGSITMFDLTTPGLEFTSASSTFTAQVFTYTPAYSPAQNFVTLFFEDFNADNLRLIFQTSLSAFDATTPLYTGPVDEFSYTSATSALNCQFPGGPCTKQVGGNFTSGTATLAPVSTPEPSAGLLMSAGLFGLAAFFGFRPVRRTRKAVA